MMTNIYPRELVFWPINNKRGHIGLFVTFNYIRKRIFQCNGVITLALCPTLDPYSRLVIFTRYPTKRSWKKIPIIPMINDACYDSRGKSVGTHLSE